MKKLTSYYLPLLILSTCLGCIDNTMKEVDDRLQNLSEERKQIYIDFSKAVNSKDSLMVNEAIVKYWSDTLIGKNNQWLQTDMNYWLAAIKEFGPLEFVSYGADEFNENKIAWFKGEITKDWIGLEFDFTKNNKIDGTNVLRSCSPSTRKIDPSTIDTNHYSEALEEYFKKMEAEDLFSGVVLVAKGNKIIHKGGYGLSDKKAGIKCIADNKMVIASTTKMFTAVAIAQLIEQGKLKLDEPISTYLNDFPKAIGDKVTIANLLTHTSGIELDEIETFMPAIRKARNIDEFYKLNIKYLPKMESYEKFDTLSALDYSNENFDLLGKLIEVASGQNFYDYLSKAIFDPVGMNNTGPIDMENNTHNIARNYQLNRTGKGTLDSGFRDEVPHSDLSYSRPAGSFYSTTTDLHSFMMALNNTVLIGDSIKTKFTSKQVENLNIPIYKSWYGYGFYVNEREGFSNYGHAGGAPGISSRCEYYPELGIYVIVISNYNGAANLAANYISFIISKDSN